MADIEIIKKQRQSKQRKQLLFNIAFILESLFLVVSIYFIVTMMSYELLPSKYRWPLALILLLVNVYFVILLKQGVKKVALRYLGMTFNTFLLCLLLVISIFMQQGLNTLDALGETDGEKQIKTATLNIRVLKASPLNTAASLKDKKIYAPITSDKENIDKFANLFKTENGFNLALEDQPSYMASVQSLLAGEADAMVLNDDHLKLIVDNYPKFEEETRVLATGKVDTAELSVKKKVNTGEEAFNIYLSGSDTRGTIDSTSRSDVNIIVTINPNTKTVLLTSVPRDTYVNVASGGGGNKDKLTHAGLHGVEASIMTLEDFFSVSINYYVRVNFTSTITLIDLLGGVDIYNPYAFDGVLGHNFAKGDQHLNGEQALAFVRERYSLPGGDFDRGKNQERVLKALIKKAMSVEILTKFSSIMELAKTSMKTNMDTNEMMRLVNLQLADPSPWKIYTRSISGVGETGWPCYMLPGYDVYVTIPDEDSIQEAKKSIVAVMRGEELSEDEDEE